MAAFTKAGALPQKLLDFLITNPRKIAEWLALPRYQPNDIQQLLDEIYYTTRNLNVLENWVTKHVAQPHCTATVSSIWGIRTKIWSLENACAGMPKAVSTQRIRLFPSVQQKRFETIKADFSTTRTELSSLTKAIMELPDYNPFVVQDMVPRKMGELHFNYAKNSKGAFETGEGELYDEIFKRSPGGPTVVVVCGPVGVGKTTAVQEIGRLARENSEQFKNSVLYVTMGQEAGVEDLKDNLAKLVKATGGHEGQVKSLRETKKVSTAIRLTGNHFKHHRCLFVFDDVWCANGITPLMVSLLVGITRNKESKLVFTTRDNFLFKDGGKNITFDKKGDIEAEKILLLHSSQTFPTSKDGIVAFKETLQRCGGLPIALGLAGAWIGQDAKENKSGEGVWRHYVTTCVGNVWDDLEDWMKQSVVRSLELADKETSFPNQFSFSFQDSFHSFSIMRPQQKVPIRIFELLWKLDKTSTANAMKSLKRFSVVEISHDSKGEFVTLHDRILDVARTLSNEQGSGEPRPSRTLIDSYTKYSDSKSVPASLWLEHFQRNWESVSNDDFISANLFRLLADAGENTAALWLTQEPAWVIKQLSNNGLVQVLKDFRIVEQYVQSDLCGKNGSEKQSIRNFLNLVRDICAVISNSHWESMWTSYPWFQLYRRMISYSGVKIVETFLKKIERDSPSLWFKPTPGCLPVADATLQTIIQLDGKILCQFEDNGEMVVVHGTAGGGCKLVKYDSLVEVIFDVVLEEGGWEWDHPNWVLYATYNLSIEAVILGMEGGRVKIWRLCNGEDFSRKIDSTGRNSNSNANPTGEPSENAVRMDSKQRKWESTVIGKDKCVSSVAMSGDGRRVVSGSFYNTVRVWDAGHSGWESTVIGKHEGCVTSVVVVISGDGRRVVSGGSGDDSVRVWDAGDSGWESTFIGKHERCVTSVAMSGDGRRVVSGSNDKAVRVWDAGDSGWESTVIGWHEDCVTSVVISGDGRRVVSGSEDKTVRVWDAGDSGWESTVIGEHEDWVMSVALSEDGRRVVSGSFDETVRVWGPADVSNCHWQARELWK